MATRQRKDEVPIKVVVRCRPKNAREKLGGGHSIVTTDQFKNLVSIEHAIGDKDFNRNFQFDGVFGPDASQETVYREVAASVIDEVLGGFSCTIFAYGQTGTGKTYTMEGEKNSPGIIPRAIVDVFQRLEKQGADYTVRCSFVELHNEELVDLLGSEKKVLRLYEDANHRRGITVHNLEEIIVQDSSDVLMLLDRALKKRVTAQTLLNKNSSRSHCVFSVGIHVREVMPDGEEVLRLCRLNLVDLAGSENISRSGAKMERAKEAGIINQSLLTLGRVINALVERQPHVPYRESKLTRLLQDSLGGRTKTCIIATICPDSSSSEETMSTLDYAYRAKNIRNRPEVNERLTKKALIKEYVEEINRLQLELQAARDKSGVFLPHAQYEKMTAKVDFQQKAIAEMEENLARSTQEFDKIQKLFNIKTSELDDAVKSLDSTKQELGKVETHLKAEKVALKKTKRSLEEQRIVTSEHKATENSLRQEAARLIDTLHDSIGNFEGVYKKLDRKAKVERHNVATLGQFEDDMGKSLKGVDGKMTAIRRDVVSSLQKTASLTRGSAANTQKTVMESISQLSDLKSALAKSSNESKARLRQRNESSVATFESMMARIKAHTEESGRRLDDMSAVMGAVASTSTQNQLQQDAMLAKSCQSLDETSEQASGILDKIVKEVDNHCSKVDVDERERLDGVTKQLQQGVSAIDVFFRDFESQCSVSRAALLKQISELLELQHHDQLGALLAFAGQMRDSLSLVETTAESYYSLAAGENARLKKAMGVFRKEYAETGKQFLEANARLKGEMRNQAASAHAKLLAEVEENLLVEAKKVRGELESLGVYAGGAFKEEKEAANVYEAMEEEYVGKSDKLSAGAIGVIGTQLGEVSGEALAMSKGVGTEVQKSQSLLERLGAMQQESVSRIQKEIGTLAKERIKVDVPTGETPMRRVEYKVIKKEELPVAQTPNTLLQDYRQANYTPESGRAAPKAVGSGGGGAVSAVASRLQTGNVSSPLKSSSVPPLLFSPEKETVPSSLQHGEK